MNGESEYITIKKASQIFGLSASVLRKWENEGILQGSRTPGGVRIFSRSALKKALGFDANALPAKRNFCYCRVSSKKQCDDLERQSDFLRSLHPEYTLIKDVGSGINFSRKGLQTILDAAMQRNIGEVVVAYRDRLARFGFDLIESLVEKGGGKIRVLDQQQFRSREDELAQDLLAIIHVFNCRQMGRRRYSHTQSQSENIPEQHATGDTSTVVRNVSICL